MLWWFQVNSEGTQPYIYDKIIVFFKLSVWIVCKWFIFIFIIIPYLFVRGFKRTSFPLTFKRPVKTLCFLHRYRLVPKVYFPEQIHDVVRATKYFLQPEVLRKYSVDPGRVGISGDSAGGNLAAALGQQVTEIPEVLVKGGCMLMFCRQHMSTRHGEGLAE